MTCMDEPTLAVLRDRIRDSMSPKRFAHTAAVEDMVSRLAALYCPEKTDLLRAAALLHDTTKELSASAQIELCRVLGIPVSEEDVLSPKTFHAKTAAALIPQNYPEFAHEEIVSAVRWHTTGHADMTLGEKLVYLADYIDDTRIFPDCVRLRRAFWEGSISPKGMSADERAKHLDRVLLMSYDMTIQALLAEGSIISPDTFHARNALLLNLQKNTTNINNG